MSKKIEKCDQLSLLFDLSAEEIWNISDDDFMEIMDSNASDINNEAQKMRDLFNSTSENIRLAPLREAQKKASERELLVQQRRLRAKSILESGPETIRSFFNSIIKSKNPSLQGLTMQFRELREVTDGDIARYLKSLVDLGAVDIQFQDEKKRNDDD